jgi:aminoglycoside phosphotransferase (APT) family kinase protein
VASGATDGGEPVVCHGDFHPLNVMVDGASAAVIDWTDAGLGPREADVARTVLLLSVAAVAASGRLERAALTVAGPRLARRYRRRYEQGAPLHERRMASWDALHALHGWAQIEMLHAGRFDAESSSTGNDARVPRELAGWLRARVEASLG